MPICRNCHRILGEKKEGERKDLYFVNFSKCVPNLRVSKRCGERERKRRGVTVGETLKHRLLGPHVARKADYRGCGLLTMIICLHDKNRWSVGKGWVVGGTRTLKIIALEKGGHLGRFDTVPPRVITYPMRVIFYSKKVNTSSQFSSRILRSDYTYYSFKINIINWKSSHMDGWNVL